MITLTIVRHGESTDNVKANWAGWADAPLSVHGMEQAKALGKHMKDVKLDALIASDLKRANWTANQVYENHAEPKPPYTVTRILREQHFGAAEGHPWSDKGKYARENRRDFKFPEGETLEDVRKRANDAIAQFLEPSLKEQRGKPANSKHIMFVAHGIFNSELVGSLLARVPGQVVRGTYRGMSNTGYTRIELGYEDETAFTPEEVSVDTDPEETVNPSAVPSSSPPLTPYDPSLPALALRIKFENEHGHTDHLVRQKGGIGSSAFDESQKTIQSFFAGGGGGSKV